MKIETSIDTQIKLRAIRTQLQIRDIYNNFNNGVDLKDWGMLLFVYSPIILIFTILLLM